MIGVYIGHGDYECRFGSIFVRVFAAVRVYMGFFRVYFADKIQADPVHVVSLFFFFCLLPIMDLSSQEGGACRRSHLLL